jgi:DNA-binding LacI/PurR family transcriptional regulator
VFKAAAELGLAVKPELTATMGNYFEADKQSMMKRGYDAAMSLMRKPDAFTALLAFNDGSALGAIRAIHDTGKSVPGNVSVVGIDDIQIAAFLSPRLTTIHQPLKQMGAIAATTLLQRIQGEEVPEETVVQPELVVRESTARLGP